jgi:hypothetical protein
MFESKNGIDAFMKSISNVGKEKMFTGLADDLLKEISKMESKLDSLLAKEEKFKKLGQIFNVKSPIIAVPDDNFVIFKNRYDNFAIISDI